MMNILVPRSIGGALLLSCVCVTVQAKPEQMKPRGTTPDQATIPAQDPHQAFHVVRETAEGMGTRLQVFIYTDESERAHAAISAALEEMARIERLTSAWLPNSEISRINRAAGDGSWIPISPETYEVLIRGQEVNAQTHGRFAMTWAALGPLWDFSAGSAMHVPSKSRAQQKAALVNDQRLVFSKTDNAPQARLERQGMALGLGGIAKGYAADRALSIVQSRGFENALVFAGGDVAFRGQKGEKPWLVGIQDPRGQGFFATLRSSGNDAIVTSGDYERFVEIGGVRYHHILDPKTGFPARGMRSVTIVAPDAMQADALSTAVFVLGETAGLKLVESLPGVDCVLVRGDNEVVVSSGIGKRLRVVRPPTP